MNVMPIEEKSHYCFRVLNKLKVSFIPWASLFSDKTKKQITNHAYNIRSPKSFRIITLRQNHPYVEIQLNSRKYFYQENIVSDERQRH